MMSAISSRIRVLFVLAIATLSQFALSQSSSSQSVPPWPTQTYKSAPSIHPLSLNITKSGPTAPGYLLLATDGSSHPNSSAPIITTDDNTLVWNGPHGHAFAFSPQTYRNQSVLAYWNGTVFPEPVGRGSGSIFILNSSYQTIANVSLPGRFLTLNASQTFNSNVDLHEIYITPNDTLLVTANNVTTADLTSVGGPSKGWVVDAQVYEIDIATNKILFSWSSLQHQDRIPLSASVYKLGTEGYNGTTQATAWGYFHINSVSPLPANVGGGYIISSRYLCSAIAIDKSGAVQWRLSGTTNNTASDFKLAANASFCYQHDIRVRSSNGTNLVISLHDNANSPLTLPIPTIPTSGLLLELDLKRRVATALARHQNSKVPIYATAQGNYQALPNGHVFMCHGFTPVIEEFSSNGTSVMTAQFGPVQKGLGVPQGGVLSYRGFRSAWVGCPATPPSVYAARDSSGQVQVYMSWNGATEYSAWVVDAGQSEVNLRRAAVVPKAGFETVVSIPGNVSYVQVQAGGSGKCGIAGFDKVSKSAIVAVVG